MTDRYEPGGIEPKWQARWEADQLYRAPDRHERPKFFFLTMYPYPSGDLHIGHWYAEAPADARARYLRMRGYNVLFPIGFDAFGLPAENAAIRDGIHPYVRTRQNIERMRTQFRAMGACFDWSREVVTCEPEYYRWNQWFFLRLYQAGLAYRARAAVDWCPKCNTTLAREQVWGDDRRCERCGTPVIRKELDQWFFRITKYADELLDFSRIDWPERVVTMQRNWIGRSEGAEIDFMLDAPALEGERISVFTTRPDTVFGVTFMVLAPEHPLVARLTTPDRRAEVESYVTEATRRTEVERQSAEREKTGVFTGSYCVNPYNGERVPVWVGDYVLMTYGTGAVMGVPAHDERDLVFAHRYGLPVRCVVAPPDWDGGEPAEAYVDPGRMVNSAQFDGLPNDEGKRAVTEWGERQGFARPRVTYRLRDWLISRQRYWGTPIPILYCDACGAVPVPESDLPVLLPEDAQFLPTGESPLKYHDGFRKTRCPRCGRPAERETDTMDTFVDSSWYQYRYLSPHDDDAPFDPELGRYWLPVDVYTGGIEHATMHLLYTRFFTKAIRDLGLTTNDEPVLRLFNQGIILGPDGQKMSKSRGNVVNPDDQVAKYGADAVRSYLMFIGPWDEGGPFSMRGIEGVSRWLNRVWNLVLDTPELPAHGDEATERDLLRAVHKTIRRVTDDLERFRFNTMIAALMEYTNALQKVREVRAVSLAKWNDAARTLLLLTAPAAPHATEELWARLGLPYSVHQQSWPEYDPTLAADEILAVAVQVNGKTRGRIEVSVDADQDTVSRQALASDAIRGWIDGREVRRVVYVRGRLVNIVVQ